MFPDPPAGFDWRVFAAGAGDRIEALAARDFPVPHGFTTRFRERSASNAALGRRECEAADLQLLAEMNGVSFVHSMRQVHGRAVRVVEDDDGASHEVSQPPNQPESDGLVLLARGAALAVKTADCVPILFADPHSGAVAGAHAGWRGTAAGVAAETARTLAAEAGVEPAVLRAVIGPAIRVCCYEVGPEVIAAFAAADRDTDRVTKTKQDARPHLDLITDNRDQLIEAGMKSDAITDSALCTRCDPAFHSYRRDGKGTGRNWSFAVGPSRSARAEELADRYATSRSAFAS